MTAHTASALLLAAAALVSACTSNPLSRKYEYEEEVYLRLDGSATVYVNAAVPALVRLRGFDLPLDPRARLDRQDVRGLYESAVVRVDSVTLSRRDNRRYVHLRLEVADIRQLQKAAPFAWSSYGFGTKDGAVEYAQTVGASAAKDVGQVGWQGNELVAFRLHLPSRITYHNSPSRTVERGNIVEWEQPLEARSRSEPVDIQVRMEPESILAQTLALFGTMILVVAVTFVAFIWYIKRRGAAPAVPADRHAGGS